jgi:outer membrane autotransporter protein
MQNKIKKTLNRAVLSLTAVVLLLLFSSAQAIAGEGTTEMTTAAIVVTDTAGLLESTNGTTTQATTIAGAAAITLGAAGTESITATGNNAALVMNLTFSGTNGVIFADDIHIDATAHNNAIINLLATNDNLTFEGSIVLENANTNVNIKSGSAAANATTTLTFDTKANENHTYAAIIDAVDSGDTVNMVITNTDSGNVNTQLFTLAIGGVVAIDSIAIGADTTPTFTALVIADQITISNDHVNTFNGGITGALALAVDGTVTFANLKGITGAITNTTGSNAKGTITGASSGTSAFGGQIGADGAAMKAMTINVSGGNNAAATFAQDVYVAAIGFTGQDATDMIDFSGDVTGAITITTGATVNFIADKKIVGSIVTASNNIGVVTFAAATSSINLASGALGIDTGHKLAAVNVITGATNAIVQTFQSTVDATAMGVTGTGTLAFTGAVDVTTLTQSAANFTTFAETLTGGLDITAANATATFAVNKGIVGTMDSSANSVGTVTFLASTADTTYVSGNAGATGAGFDAINVSPGIVSSVAKVGTFGGTVQADLLTHSGAGTVAFVDDTDVTTINLTADGKLSFAAAKGQTGAITTGTTNTGSIDFVSGTQAVSGDIGASGTVLKLITQGPAGVSGALTFNGDVFATQLTINSTGSVTMGSGDDLNANVYFDAAGTLNLHTAGMTGDVTTETGGTGTVAMAQNGTITGNLGTATESIGMVDIGGNVVLTGNIYATEVDIAAVTLTMPASKSINGLVDFSADGTLTLADGSNVTGLIKATGGSGEGTVNVAGATTIGGEAGLAAGNPLLLVAVGAAGDLTLGDSFKGTQVTVADGGKITYSKAVTTHTGNLIVTLAGTVDVGTTTTTVTGTLTMPATSIFKVTIGDTNGKLVHSTAVAAFVNTTGKIEPLIKGRITSGTGITIFDGSATPNTPTVTDNYARYTFALTVDGNNLVLTPTLVTPAGVSSNSAKVSAIADVAFASDSAMNDALQGLSGAALDKALTTLAPSVDGGAIVGSISAGSASGATISTQIASLRSGIAAGSGLNAGDGANDKRFWTQGFGTSADQDVREKINGFKATTGGVAMGVDKRVRPDTVVGVAYSFSHTDVDTKDSKNGTKVKGHQATFYGTHDFDRGVFGTDGVFVDGQLSYAFNDYSGSRYIEVGAVTRKADSEFDGGQISTKFDLGKTVNFADKLRFTPTAGLSYTHVSVDKFTETGAGDSSLSLKKQDYDILNLNVKAKLARTWEVNGADVTPEMHVGYSYEAIHDKIQTTSSFTGGGNSFISTGFEPANHTYSGGMGLTFGASDKMPVDITFTYDFSGKDDFESHSGLVKGAWTF